MPLLNDLTDAVLESLKKGPPVWKRVYDELLTFGRMMYGQSGKSSQVLNFEELLTFLYQDFPWKSDEVKHLSRGLYFHVVEVASEVIKKRQRTLSKKKLSQSDIKNFLWYLHLNESKVITLNYDTILEDSAIYLLKPWIYQDDQDTYQIDKNEEFTNGNNKVAVIPNNDDDGIKMYFHGHENINDENFREAYGLAYNNALNKLGKKQTANHSRIKYLFETASSRLLRGKLEMQYFSPYTDNSR